MQPKAIQTVQSLVRSALIGSVLAVVLIGLITAAAVWKYTRSEYVVTSSKQPILTTTPPMGWNSWNVFRCDREFNEKTIQATINRMVDDGYAAAGYRYVVLDDCWQSSRAANGEIQVDKERFPGGMPALVEYAHQRGLLFGIYTSAGRTTCEGMPGSYGFEQQDIKTFQDWQVDFIKLDWCGADYLHIEQVYRKWQALIDQSQRPIVLSIAVAQTYRAYDGQTWLWGDEVSDMRRVTRDIQDDWSEMLSVFDSNSHYAAYQKIGKWNDAGILEVGNGGMTFEEYRTHFGLWTMMSSPLMLGTDLRSLSPELKDILLNREVLAINQDKLGLQGEVIFENDAIQVISKPLLNRGSRAVLIINRGKETVQFALRPQDLKLVPIMYFKQIWPTPQASLVIAQHSMSIAPHDSVLAIVQGIDSASDVKDLLPALSGQVRSGNLTRQTAFDVYGLFDYDEEFMRGESIGVRNNSSIRYHLNNLCQRFQVGFEFVRSEKSPDQSSSLNAEVYLDGDKVMEYVATPASPTAQLDVSLKNVRVLDLVTHTSATSAVTHYGRWTQPIIECQNELPSLGR